MSLQIDGKEGCSIMFIIQKFSGKTTMIFCRKLFCLSISFFCTNTVFPYNIKNLLNFKIGFQDFEKTLNLAIIYVKY